MLWVPSDLALLDFATMIQEEECAQEIDRFILLFRVKGQLKLIE